MRSAASQSTLRSSLAQYFEDNHFGADGGYSSPWVDFKFGPVPFPFPNTDARRRAVRYHDLHHIVTGYQTDVRGEFEISAWEIGSGCRDFAAAWALNLSGMAAGMLLCPARTFRAFLRGRGTDNFYGHNYDDALLETSVVEAKRALRVDESIRRATGEDALLFGLAWGAGISIGTFFLVTLAPVVLVAMPFLSLAAKRAKARERDRGAEATTDS